MIRIATITLSMIIALQGFAFGQGLLDSVFGPGGLGLWGGNSSGQFNPQGYQESPPMPQQQQYPQPPAAPGQQYPSAAGYPQQYYGQQQGVYSDWQNQPPAVIGSTDQYGGSQQYPQQQPQQQYAEQPQYQQYPAQQQYQQQYPPQQPQYAPPQQQYGPQPMPAAQSRAPQRPLRPGQYAPGQSPVGPGQMRAEDLPAGSVRVTTTTPDGTTVQYYPPSGEPDESVGRTPRQRRLVAPKPARTKQMQKNADQTPGVGAPRGAAPIAMPKPVEIPQGQDPRYGWGAAVDRAPSAPPVR